MMNARLAQEIIEEKNYGKNPMTCFQYEDLQIIQIQLLMELRERVFFANVILKAGLEMEVN